SKDEILGEVWAEVTVSEESLTRCISDIRQALGDEAQSYIKTVPRRGYQLAVPVSAGTEDTSEARLEAQTASTPSSPEKSIWVRPLCLVAVTATIAAAVFLARAPSPIGPTATTMERPAIAVLPFTHLDGDATYDYFADGLANDLTTRLSRLPQLVV